MAPKFSDIDLEGKLLENEKKKIEIHSLKQQHKRFPWGRFFTQFLTLMSVVPTAYLLFSGIVEAKAVQYQAQKALNDRLMKDYDERLKSSKDSLEKQSDSLRKLNLEIQQSNSQII